jgi:Holliday junction resolvase
VANKNRAAGDLFERRTRDTFRSREWWVIRSAGSLGPADLVALKRGRPPLLVACKVNGRMDPRERAVLLDLALATGGVPLIAYRDGKGWVGLDRLTPDDRRESAGRWHMPPVVRGGSP